MKKLKLIALFSALIVGFGLYQFLKEIGKPQEVPHTTVLVAAVDIPENTQITEEMVTLKSIATESLLEYCLKDVESVIGLVVSSDVYAGEQITSNRLIRMGETEDTSNTLAYVVEPGMRAVTVNVTAATGVSSLLKPGNHVDVIINYTEQYVVGEETISVPTSQLYLQNCIVLAVNSVMKKTGMEEYATVTLQTTPDDAVKVSFAEYIGNVRLILRSSLDDEIQPELQIDSVSDEKEDST